jgi:hypothetical protein
MPVQKCTKDGKSGWKYGGNGVCYTGPGAKKKAIKQGLAIEYNGGPKFESKSDAWMDAKASEILSRRDELLDDIRRVIEDKRNFSKNPG